eukprot:CAMPEP_0197887792 /NCGR_PEP_ID=MMETSP1439-20131203/19609_1 /TAXON_ID=66791 /ORGANISM="Gonyaulax spinifera, Strain CCMP409" /LENGTH=157 /DNA_ID=CAMNT_0043507647 /DNA_START=514 /DNA_END=987 /DNA_ORIENTATION=+
MRFPGETSDEAQLIPLHVEGQVTQMTWDAWIVHERNRGNLGNMLTLAVLHGWMGPLIALHRRLEAAPASVAMAVLAVPEEPRGVDLLHDGLLYELARAFVLLEVAGERLQAEARPAQLLETARVGKKVTVSSPNIEEEVRNARLTICLLHDPCVLAH